MTLKTVFISIIGHITVFSIFSLSFSNNIPKGRYVNISFWGQFLHNSQVTQPIAASPMFYKQDKSRIVTKLWGPVRDTDNSRNSIIAFGIKPQSTLPFTIAEKEILIREPLVQSVTSRKPKPSIIFHPLLPYSFTLYFKDRQIAHVELSYKIISQGERNSVLLKRKVSSGNLEVDLLTMRYIGRYLSIREASGLTDSQRSRSANNWQTVKIDLSAK